MTRAPNRTAGNLRPGIVLPFTPGEFRVLKVNTPGPSGTMGGYQQMENILIGRTDPSTLRCPLGPVLTERLIRYIMKYKQGGPNGRIRRACVPALHRIGIDVQPDERAA